MDFLDHYSIITSNAVVVAIKGSDVRVMPRATPLSRLLSHQALTSTLFTLLYHLYIDISTFTYTHSSDT